MRVLSAADSEYGGVDRVVAAVAPGALHYDPSLIELGAAVEARLIADTGALPEDELLQALVDASFAVKGHETMVLTFAEMYEGDPNPRIVVEPGDEEGLRHLNGAGLLEMTLVGLSTPWVVRTFRYGYYSILIAQKTFLAALAERLERSWEQQMDELVEEIHIWAPRGTSAPDLLRKAIELAAGSAAAAENILVSAGFTPTLQPTDQDMGRAG